MTTKILHVKYDKIKNHDNEKHMGWLLRNRFFQMHAAEWAVYEKLHGANICFAFDRHGKTKVFFRKGEKEVNFLGSADVVAEMTKRLTPIKRYAIINYKTVRIYGELFGQGVIKKNGINYGPKKRIKFFNITINEVPINMRSARTLMMDLSIDDLFLIPLNVYTTLEEALKFDTKFNTKFYEVNSSIENLCEGVVIKPWEVIITDNHERLVYFKKKNIPFREKSRQRVRKHRGQKHDRDIVQHYADQFLLYINHPRIQSIFSKHGMIKDVQQISFFIKEIIEDARETFLDEESQFVIGLYSKAEQKYIFNGSKEIVNLLRGYLTDDI